MIKVLVHGSGGKMGDHVMAEIAKSDDMELFCGVDPKSQGPQNYKYYDSFDKVEGKPVLLAAHDGEFDLAKLYLRRCFFTGTTVQGVIDLFAGNVEVKRCGGLGLELTVKAKTQGLSQEFPTRKFYPQGTFTTTNGTIKENGENDNYCVITPFVPLKEVLL
jgi:hypothetical protein